MAVVLLAMLRCTHPELAFAPAEKSVSQADSAAVADSLAASDSLRTELAAQSAAISRKEVASVPAAAPKPLGRPSRFFAADGTPCLLYTSDAADE